MAINWDFRVLLLEVRNHDDDRGAHRASMTVRPSSAHPSASTGRSSTVSSWSLNRIAPLIPMGPDPKKAPELRLQCATAICARICLDDRALKFDTLKIRRFLRLSDGRWADSARRGAVL